MSKFSPIFLEISKFSYLKLKNILKYDNLPIIKYYSQLNSKYFGRSNPLIAFLAILCIFVAPFISIPYTQTSLTLDKPMD